MAKDAKNNKKEIKNKKHFFKDFKAELKKVIWPTTKQIVNSTIAVITIVLIFALIVFILDFIFKVANEKGIDKIKANIKNKVVVENIVEGSTLEAEVNNAEEQSSNGLTVENESSVDNVQ